MGTHSHHLTLEDRCDLARLHAAGRSLRHIAATLDRPPSTVAREMKRNRSRIQGPAPLCGAAGPRPPVARRQVGPRCPPPHHGPHPPPTGLAPRAGGLARDAGRPVSSHETIYRFLYAQIARTKTYAWRHYLPRAKATRGRRRTRRSPAALMAHRRSLAERPAVAADRQTPGHGEADLMLFRTYGQAVLTLAERTSRLLLAGRAPRQSRRPHRPCPHPPPHPNAP